MKTKKEYVLTILLVAFVIIAIIFVVNERKATQVMAQQYSTKLSEVSVVNSNKVDALKNDVLDRLKQCESGDLKISDAPILLDTNHKISMGMFMFQRNTVIYYYKKLYHQTIDRHTAVDIALSPAARTLASDIIFKERGGIFNWANCAKQKNLVTEVTIIKRIQ
ncbi:MAG TPA: hypothetical protein ENI63_00865 [Candidatus Kaiserbacteria bacterium]|mgnify:CR=1 FL=1|nr:hypothetical protein [Candidatus Kaiserbacteria bacterium]